MEHLAKTTLGSTQLNLDALYQIAPSCFTEAKGEDGEMHHVVDFTKLRMLLGDKTVEDAPEVYDFTWVGKRAALKEAAAPIQKTLRPCKDESVDWDTTQNLYIEGDNLEVLKLLQNSYMGKVKMIYIDPPYNTGNDFVYHDDFSMSREEYDDSSSDEEGNRYWKNTDSNGRFHSDWCSMIYARLMIARTLLKDDGVIYVHIDDNEVENLGKICNEVFGESNFLNIITIKTKIGGVSGSSEGKSLKDVTEFIWAFAKNKEVLLLNPVYNYSPLYKYIQEYIENGKSWKYTSIITKLEGKELIKYDHKTNMSFYGYSKLETMSISAFAKKMSLTEEKVYEIYADKIFRTTNAQSSVRQTVIRETAGLDFPMYGCEYIPIKGKNEGAKIEILYKSSSDNSQRNMVMFLSDVVEKINGSYYYKEKVSSLWDDIEYNNLTKEGDIEFSNGKKPIKLIQRLLNLSTNEDSIVLDFFSGSASTAHAVMQLNAEDSGKRKFIMVQLQEETDKDSDYYKTGYKNICEIGKERIRRAGKKIKEESPLTTLDLDTGFRVLKCEESNYKDVAFAPKDYSQDMLAGLLDNIKEDRNDLDLLFDCMLRWGVTLDLPMTTSIVDGCTIHNVNDGDLVACFSGTVTEAVIDAIAKMQPLRVVFRDNSFAEAANKMNLFELFKQKCNWTDQEVQKNIRVI